MTEILNAVRRPARRSGESEISVAIVIPAYNEERFIGRCLTACLCQTALPDEIIVVNNRSTDATAAIVRRFQAENRHVDIRLLTQDEFQGIAPTRNYGFDRVRSAVIGRIDADSSIAPDWVETIRRRFRNLAVDAVTGPVWYYDMPLREAIFRLDRAVRDRLHRRAGDQRFLFGSNMAVRTSAWRAVRHLTRLDLEDQLHEDIDLALTLFKNGFEIEYESSLVAGVSGRRVENSPRDFYRYAMRYLRTTKAHRVHSRTAGLTIAVLLLGYFPAHVLRFCYDGESNRYTLAKLHHEVRGRRRQAPQIGQPAGVRTGALGRAALLPPPVAVAMLSP
ncbi:hypothetical protein A5656_23955 [Mycobacterium gordonae]|nr:glycosyltransferase family 2 protein [Mycobacterium gordonae]OBK52991.1 hypothetical protein A5656_23955 [Mycobacterium gordonae]